MPAGRDGAARRPVRQPRIELASRIAATLGVCTALLSALPAPAAAQIGIYDALARRFSDVSFFGNIGWLSAKPPEIRADRLSAFGIEVLLTIGGVSRPTGPAVQKDTAVLTWTEMRVVVNENGTDTIYTYEVKPGAVHQPSTPIWSFELGLGYGQTTGFESDVPGFDLHAGVRDLPTVSLYASYVPSGTYFGLRSGFMKLQSLQVYDDAGSSWAGEADSFMAGAVVGQVWDVLNLSLFAEAGYSMRPFPSIRWSGPTLPAGIPRELSLHSWTVGAGIQFSLGFN
jgi:hypothetical protein